MVRKNTWILLGIFVILLGGAYAWQRSQTQKAPEATPTAGQKKLLLFEIQTPVNSVRIEQAGGKQLEMKLDKNGKWQITSPAGLEADSEAAAATLSQLGAIPLVTTLQGASDLASMGLDQPAYRLLVTTEDGQSWVVNIGKVTPTTSGYYALSSDRILYVVSKVALDPILGLVDAPPLKQETPTPGAVGPDATLPAAGVTPVP